MYDGNLHRLHVHCHSALWASCDCSWSSIGSPLWFQHPDISNFHICYDVLLWCSITSLCSRKAVFLQFSSKLATSISNCHRWSCDSILGIVGIPPIYFEPIYFGWVLTSLLAAAIGAIIIDFIKCFLFLIFRGWDPMKKNRKSNSNPPPI
jgi:hypothetical protein